MKRFADIRVFAHFFDQRQINNPRSGEVGFLDTEGQIDSEQETTVEEPNSCLSIWDFGSLALHGDAWNDDFASLRNLVHQLHSLREVYLAAAQVKPEVFVFVRPDLWYYDDIGPVIRRALHGRDDVARIPSWQPFMGENDRFAVVKGERAARQYAARIEKAKSFCVAQGSALHAESLLGYALMDVTVRHISHRAARVRADGRVHVENFSPGWIVGLHTRVSNTGFHPQVRRVFHKSINILNLVDDIRQLRLPIPRTVAGGMRMGFPRLWRERN